MSHDQTDGAVRGERDGPGHSQERRPGPPQRPQVVPHGVPARPNRSDRRRREQQRVVRHGVGGLRVPADDAAKPLDEGSREGVRGVGQQDRHKVDGSRGRAGVVGEGGEPQRAAPRHDAQPRHAPLGEPGDGTGLTLAAGDEQNVRHPPMQRGRDQRGHVALRLEADAIDDPDPTATERGDDPVAQARPVLVIDVEDARAPHVQPLHRERPHERPFDRVVRGQHEGPRPRFVEQAAGAARHDLRDTRLVVDRSGGQRAPAAAVANHDHHAWQRGKPARPLDLTVRRVSLDDTVGDGSARHLRNVPSLGPGRNAAQRPLWTYHHGQPISSPPQLQVHDPMRAFRVLLALAGLASAAAPAPLPARQPIPSQPQAQDTTRGRPGGPGQEGPKPYAQVITRGATTDSGVFIVHRLMEKLFYEIPRAQLGKEFLLVVDYAATPEGTRYGGGHPDTPGIRWQRMGNRVLLRSVSYDVVADSSTPVSRAVRLSNLEPVLMSFDVAAFSPNADSNLVIEVTRLFTTDVPELTARRAFRLPRLDPARSLVETARSVPTNIHVKALHTFENDSLPGDRGLGTMSFQMHYSMVLLPDHPMAERLCDNRVGYFSVRQLDYGREGHRVAERCYITRWRLDPKNPNAAVSDPVQPIVFYLDPATPEKWAPWLIKGVEAWEPVFRAAGFSNAITARRAPTPQRSEERRVGKECRSRWSPD